MTKSELREMIRECLREELANTTSLLEHGHKTSDPGYYADSIFAILDSLSNDEIYTFLGEYPRYEKLAGECIRDLYDNINHHYLDNYSGYQLYSDLCNFFEVTEINGSSVLRESRCVACRHQKRKL